MPAVVTRPRSQPQAQARTGRGIEPEQAQGKERAEVPTLLWIAGRNNIPYPAHFYPSTRKLVLLGLDSPSKPPEGRQRPTGPRKPLRANRTGKALQKAVQAHLLALCAETPMPEEWAQWTPFPGARPELLLKAHFTQAELKAQGLKWVTAHPNGPGTEGTPILVHDDGDTYTVVGGAGGSMNQLQVKKTGKEDPEAKSARKKKADEEAEKRRAQDPEAFAKIEAAKKEYGKQSKAATKDLRDQALEKLGTSLDQLKADAANEAVKKLRAANPGASAGDVQNAIARAERGAEQAAKAHVDQVVRTALDAVARAEINQEAPEAADVTALVAGKQLTRTMTPEEMSDLVTKAATLDSLKTIENALGKAFRQGRAGKAGQIDLNAVEGAPTASEAAQYAKDGFLQRKSVKTHASLVRESKLATPAAQHEAQALGGTDALNAYGHAMTGQALVSPELVKRLGVDGAARVVAAHLLAQGGDAKQLAADLEQRISERSDMHAAAALKMGAELDALTLSAKRAAEAHDGTVPMAQAHLIAMQNSAKKFKALNLARGQLEAAASLLQHLQRPSAEPVELAKANTAAGLQDEAEKLGIPPDSYTVKQQGSSFVAHVEAKDLGGLVTPVDQGTAERAQKMAAIKQDLADGKDWRSPNQNPNISLSPHQILFSRATTELGSVLGNLGAGSGKTASIYTAADSLFSSGRADRGIITMPAKPRSQQMGDEGEARKFLTEDGAKHFHVTESSADLKTALADLQAGKPDAKRGLIMSPEMARDHLDDLTAAGFGGKGSFHFADEAHELSIAPSDLHAKKPVEPTDPADATGAVAPSPAEAAGSEEDDREGGSGKAKMAERLAQSEFTQYGSGTAIENNAGELHGLLHLVNPQAFPRDKAQAFQDQWSRTAQGGPARSIFGPETMNALSAQVNPYMVHYHAPVSTGDGAGGQKELKLNQSVVKVPLSDGQRSAVQAAHKQFQADSVSDDPSKRKAAALRRDASIRSAMIGPGMHDAIINDIRARQAADPTFRAVIWSGTLKPIHELKAKLEAAGLGNVGIVTGAQSDHETLMAAKAFNDPKQPHSALIISNAGNFGLNAQGGNAVYKMMLPDTASKDEQIDKRAYRRGQMRDVDAKTFVGDHPLSKQRLYKVRKQKAADMKLLASLADDSGVAGILAARGIPSALP